VLELAPDGIRVDTVALAFVETPSYERSMSAEEAAELLESVNGFHRSAAGVGARRRRVGPAQMRRLPVLVVLVALAACGGGDGDAREQFVEQANANCAERQEAERELRRREEESGDFDPDGWKKLFDEELEKQRELEPPEELAADWRRYQQLSRQSIAMYRELDDIYERRDRGLDETSVLQGKAGRASTQSRVVARKLGLDVCAKQIY
jgi:hypothetical protein